MARFVGSYRLGCGLLLALFAIGCKPVDDFLSVGSKLSANDVTPAAVIVNSPTATSNSTALSVSVSGTALTSYRYKIGASASTDCSIETGYGTSKVSISQPITDSLASLADGSLTLCVLGTNSIGVEQALSSATSQTWLKDTVPPTLSYAGTSGTFMDASNASTFVLNGTCSEEGRTVTVTGSITTSATCTAGVWSKTIDASTMADGPLNLSFALRDAAGNTSAALGTAIDKDTGPPANVSFSKLDASVVEANAPTSFTLSSSIAKLYATQISYSVAGTAIAGVHHSLTSGTVTLPAGQTSVSVPFNIINNAMPESERRIAISLAGSNRGNVKLGAASTHLIDIQDDDSGAYQSILAMAAGQGNSTCVIYTGGALKCWGGNSYGQLGNGTTSSATTAPTTIDSGVSYKSIIAGGGPSTCGITAANTVKCWGWNGGGQLGDGTLTQQTSPTVADGGATYKSVWGGSGAHYCGVDSSDHLKCWGVNTSGEIGDGTIAANRKRPTAVDATVTYANAAIGRYHTCAVTTGGVLKCWGDNSSSQLGDGTTTSSSTPIIIDAGTAYLNVTAGWSSTCAITVGHVLKCWGTNTSGQLGDGTTVTKTTPTVIDAGTSYLSAALSISSIGYGCGITTANILKCWGLNTAGQLGNGGKTNSLVPIAIDATTTYSSVSISDQHACALPLSGGNIKCWGNDTNTQVTTKSSTATSVRINAGTNYDGLARGEYHSCGIAAGGALSCWGDNTNGQIGDGTLFSRAAAVSVDAGTNYASISASVGHTCGITTAGALKCWGLNSSGEIGDGSTTNRSTPVRVDSPTLYSFVSTAMGATCALTTTGVLKCWGDNTYNQLGDGTTTARLTPTVIDPGVAYKSISLNRVFGCGVTTGKVLKCWGLNTNGQVGDGTTTTRATPVTIDAAVSYAQTSVTKSDYGNFSACAITDAGTMKCWGDNFVGQLGDGTTTNRLVPTTVDAATTYASLSVGYVMGCGITTGKALKCWGYNPNGELGDGTTTTRNAPVLIDGGTSYSDVRSRNGTTCGITAAGALKCWGLTSNGLFSRGDRTNMPTPIANLLEP